MVHIIKNPAGTFSYVGQVPVTLMRTRKPTREDIMGGRVLDDGLAYVGKSRPTIERAVQDALMLAPGHLCGLDGCACREMF